MIVLDSTVLVYAVGEDHALREPCRRLVQAIIERRVEATTTPEVIQEFVHVRARRRERGGAADLGRDYARILAPLLTIGEVELALGLQLFEDHPELGAFDAVLAAAARASRADGLVSSDRAFRGVADLRWVNPATFDLDELLAG
jgi:uncharacterized protein